MNLATTRLNKELRQYMNMKENSEIQLYLKDNVNIYSWQAKLKGPPDTPYSEGVFYVNMDIPEDYPISPPKCKFFTKVFHPNIHFDTGEICFELLKDKWSPAWSLESVCRAILDLLSHPNADSPLNCDCGKIQINLFNN
jgi:peroxin-4